MDAAARDLVGHPPTRPPAMQAAYPPPCQAGRSPADIEVEKRVRPSAHPPTLLHEPHAPCQGQREQRAGRGPGLTLPFPFCAEVRGLDCSDQLRFAEAAADSTKLGDPSAQQSRRTAEDAARLAGQKSDTGGRTSRAATMLEKGADRKAVDKVGPTCRALAGSAQPPPLVLLPQDGTTALHCACSYRHGEALLGLLSDHGPNIAARDRAGTPPQPPSSSAPQGTGPPPPP